MPTVYAGALSAGAPKALAPGLQGVAALIVVRSVWRAFRGRRIDERAAALALIGTFLATPHAFNYDMPMTSAAIVAFFVARRDAGREVSLGELVAAAPLSRCRSWCWRYAARRALFFLPLALMFAVLARSDAGTAKAEQAGSLSPPGRANGLARKDAPARVVARGSEPGRMSDIFQEVDEEVRRDKAAEFWTKYQNFMSTPRRR